MKVHLVVPMSGQGTRFQKAGYSQPKPLIPVNGKPIIERLLEKIPLDWPCTFILAENHRGTDLPTVLKQLRPQAELFYIPVHQQGPSHAIELCLNQMKSDLPILVSYCDYGFSWDAHDFANFVEHTQCDACLISYRGFHAHYLSPTTYAFSRLEGDLVKEVKEKGSFTSNRENEFASCGAYYFRSKKILAEAIKDQKRLDLSFNGEHYTSLTIEALLRTNPDAHVRVYEIPYFLQWGTPEDLQDYEYWERCYRHQLNLATAKTEVDQVLMPMAGQGSRLSQLFQTPKPFLKIDGIPMYQRALQSLPRAKKKIVFVALKQMQNHFSKDEKFQWIGLDSSPQGQALSVQSGLSNLEKTGDILVSACDHSLSVDPALWAKFRENPDCDAAILTIKGFPGTRRRPQAFAYVKNATSEATPLVEMVSVKVPLSDRPQNDDLLVGTFWFKDLNVLEENLRELVKDPSFKVNNEFYLDSVFNLMIKKGFRVRNIPLVSYVNWGDPDSLAEGLYWREYFFGNTLQPRNRYRGASEC